MRLLFINNDGGGFANYVDVAPGTTVAQFLQKHLSDQTPENFMLRVNRQPVASDQVLQEGDRISATPVKIAGA